MSSNLNLSNIKLKLKLSKPHESETKENKTRPNSKTHGHINGIKPGTLFKDRYSLSQAGLHAPPQAGIAGTDQRGGTESVVFNGNYPYGDGGDIIWYMGSGGFKCPITGRPTKKMSSDQTITGAGNKSLVEALKTSNPIRVIRGSSIQNSPWAPMEGYRYDGLYKVTKQIKTIDPSHETEFTCYMWRMERILDEQNDYKIPVKNGMELLALKRSKEGIARKYREDIKASKLNQNELISKIVPKKRYQEDSNKNPKVQSKKSALSKTGNNLINDKMMIGSSQTITMKDQKPKAIISYEQALLRKIKITKKSNQPHSNLSIKIPQHQKNSMLIQSSSTSTISISNSNISLLEENPNQSNLSSPLTPLSTPHSPSIINQTTNHNFRLIRDLPKPKEKGSNHVKNHHHNDTLVQEDEIISKKVIKRIRGKLIKEHNSDPNESAPNHSNNEIQESIEEDVDESSAINLNDELPPSIEEDIDELIDMNLNNELQPSDQANHQDLDEEEGMNWLSFIEPNRIEEEEDTNWALLNPKTFLSRTNIEHDPSFQDLMILPASITTNQDNLNHQNHESLMDPNIYHDHDHHRIEFDFDHWKYFVDGFEIVDHEE